MGLIGDQVDLTSFIEKQLWNLELRRQVAAGEVSEDEVDPNAMVDPYDAVLYISDTFGELIFNNGTSILGKKESDEYAVNELNEQLNGLIDGLVALCDRDIKKAMAVALTMLHIGNEQRMAGTSSPLGVLLRSIASSEIDGEEVQTVSFEGPEAEEVLKKILSPEQLRGMGLRLRTGTETETEIGLGISDEEKTAKLNEWLYHNVAEQTDFETDDEYNDRIMEVVRQRLASSRTKPGAPIPGGKTEMDEKAAALFFEVIDFAVNEKGESENVDYLLRLKDMADVLVKGIVGGPTRAGETDVSDFMSWIMDRCRYIWKRPDLADRIFEVGAEGGKARRVAIVAELRRERADWLRDQAAERDETELGGEG